MQTLRRVGRDTGALTDEELRYIDNRIVEAVRPGLVARKLFPLFQLPNAGLKTVRGYKATDMSQASIDMEGNTDNEDRVELAGFDISVPVIHKSFTIAWRDIEAARNSGMPIDTMNAENAARQVMEEEEKLCLSGEYTGWRSLGIEGLATATGRNTKASAGAWPANCITDLSAAISELETDSHLGPYALLLRSSWYAKLRTLITSTGIFYLEKVKELFTDGIFVSDSLYSSGGLTTSGLALELRQENFELVVEENINARTKPDLDGNIKGKVREVVAPRIKRPTSICEVTGLT
jgi:uncharacterized linocin/CFP29 family protein